MTTRGDGFFTFLTPAEIYHQLTQGRGPGPLVEVQQDLYRETPEEEDRADLIASLGELIATGWEGQAGAAAQGAALPLRDHVLANADKLDRAQDLLSRQVGSFETAKNSVRPVSDPPEQPLDEAFPFDTDHEKQVAGYQADAQHNMSVFRQYDGASEYNETNMPQEFHAGGRDGGDVSVRSADTIEVGEPGPGTRPDDGSPGAAEPGDASQPGNPGWSSSGYPGDSSGDSGGDTESSGILPSRDGRTVANDYRPGQVGTHHSPGYSYPLPGPQAPVSGPPGGFVGGVPVGEAPAGGHSGGGSGGGGVPRGGSGPAVRRPGGAVGAGALAAEENAVRRGVQGAAARGGVGPMGAPLGAGRGKGDEDAEHERKVLIESDSEETFGSDVLTAPQVIGDDEYED